MKLVLKRRSKASKKVEQKEKERVFRFLKRLDNGDLLLFGFVPKYRKLYGKITGKGAN